jgi:hypothetical protein
MSSNDGLRGTFAVDDHLRKHAFVAELVLFDRVVLPQPPENDTEEYKRWTDLRWRPDDLRETVKTLPEYAQFSFAHRISAPYPVPFALLSLP